MSDNFLFVVLFLPVELALVYLAMLLSSYAMAGRKITVGTKSAAKYAALEQLDGF